MPTYTLKKQKKQSNLLAANSIDNAEMIEEFKI